MSQPSGAGAIVGEAVAAARDALPAPSAADQLGLDLATEEAYLEPDPAAIVAVQHELGCDASAAVAEWRRRGGRGRKPGAVNRSSADLAKYLTQFGPDPLVALMRMSAMPVDMLAATLGCTKGDAWDRRLKVLSELAPYFHGKKPISIDVGQSVAMVIMPGMPGLDGQIVAYTPGALPGAESVEDQGLTVAAIEVSE